jgi:hypothetical protein
MAIAIPSICRGYAQFFLCGPRFFGSSFAASIG